MQGENSFSPPHGTVVELVDTPDLKSVGIRAEGSSPSRPIPYTYYGNIPIHGVRDETAFVYLDDKTKIVNVFHSGDAFYF